MMSFNYATGLMTPAQERLSQLLISGHIPHALLLCGPGEPKKEAAYLFARRLLATDKPIEKHPDIHLYFPEGKLDLHPVENLRRLMNEVTLVPYEGAWKVFIVHAAEQMLPTSSNALLKTVEEPAPQTIIILLSSHPERLLPTLASRCHTLFFPESKQIALPPALLEVLSGHAKCPPTIDQENPDTLFEAIMCWYRDRLLIEMGGDYKYLHFPTFIDQIKKTPSIPLDLIETRLKQARLAHERATKLSLCLDIFFLSC